MSVAPNPPIDRFRYIAKIYGERSPDVALDTFMVLSDTVGIDHPERTYGFARIWIPAMGPVGARLGEGMPDLLKRVDAWTTGQIEDERGGRWVAVSALLEEALEELPHDRRMQVGRASDALWPWVATHLNRQKKRAVREIAAAEERFVDDEWGRTHAAAEAAAEYIDLLVELDGRGPALALWQGEERIDLGRYSLQEALDELEDFEVEARDISQGEVVHRFDDGWTVQRLEPDQLADESEAMQHCIKDYCDLVRADEAVIYSLRDPNGKPHATIHFGTAVMRVIEVEGKQNRAPKPQYQRRIDEFIERMQRKEGWRPAGELVLEERAQAIAWGRYEAESDWQRNCDQRALTGPGGVFDDDPPHTVHPTVIGEEKLVYMLDYYPKTDHLGYAMPPDAFDLDTSRYDYDPQDLADTLANLDLYEPITEAIGEAWRERYLELMSDASDQIDYTVEDTVKEALRQGWPRDAHDDIEEFVRDRLKVRLSPCAVNDTDVEFVADRVDDQLEALERGFGAR